MNDNLQKLLRRADASAPAPSVNVTTLPESIRRSRRNRRRLSACGLASAFLVGAITLFVCRPHQPLIQPPLADTDFQALQLDAEVHERTAALLLAAKPRVPAKIDPNDTFLANLAAQRNQTALLLLRDADRLTSSDDPAAAAATLRRAIELFPETIAAARATKQLEHLQDSRRQS